MTSVESSERLRVFAEALIDQHRARIIVPPQEDRAGFWFGGGNLIEDDGRLLLVGRYRNAGDSRTGLARGDRGLELAIFESLDGEHFDKRLSFEKDDLAVDGREVVSIEGAALYHGQKGYELFVSTEKDGVSYPRGLEGFKKPGTGVWSIDRIAAGTLEGLKTAPVNPLVASEEPGTVHVKDPSAWQSPRGDTVVFFCTHPFTWSSSNAGFIVRPAGSHDFGQADFAFFPRGPAWDVAVSRITDVVTLPEDLTRVQRPVNLVFYDGAECMRPLDENAAAVKRPRGYSCEELGGLAYFEGDSPATPVRISTALPLFVSPWGTGSARYVHVTVGTKGLYATWQQSRPSGAQPLVMNFVDWEALHRLWSMPPTQLPEGTDRQ